MSTSRFPRSLCYYTSVLLVFLLGCAKDSPMEDAGDKFFKGITNRDTALLRTVSSRKLLATVAHDGWPAELLSAKPPEVKTSWISKGHTTEGDTVAIVQYVLTNVSGGREASADCKLRLVKEAGLWKVEDLTPLQAQ
jgi:hypothetical protein